MLSWQLCHNGLLKKANDNKTFVSLSRIPRAWKVFIISFESCLVQFGLEQNLEFCNESVSARCTQALHIRLKLLFVCRVNSF
jgi:hypothetical protein